ncbi:baseplate J/gp47 family protein [Clostridioides difficile]|uniref:baseplate J/gp47 family protein n=1 Tax=Clostridioides difficile TaxID=1496 RepID=UPI003AA8AAEB
MAKGVFNIDIPIDSIFNLGEYNYIATERISEGIYKMKCETAGTIFELGQLIPIGYIDGLETAELTDILINGEDEESEDSLRQRYYDSLNSQSFGGNIQNYKDEVNKLLDVGGVKVYPVWNGGGTVKLVIINSNFKVPSSDLVNLVQEEIDPLQNQGEGLGLAPIGHRVTVEGITSTTINISAEITYKNGYTWENIKTIAEEAINDYLNELNMSWEDAENKEIKTLHEKLNDLSSDQFLEDLTPSGIKRWEKIMSINPKSNETLEDRRFRIFSKYISKLPYSERFLRNWLDNVVGEGNYELTINNATYNIHLESDARNQDWFEEVHSFVSNIKPCNMTLDYTRVLISKDNYMNFGITTLMGQEITIYPWSPPDIETYGEIDVLTLQHSKICKT